ncbi:MAG: hypothetical protein ACYTF3_06710 [Planctomycetota bacterium]|jgi:anti-sigma-K factor RskA
MSHSPEQPLDRLDELIVESMVRDLSVEEIAELESLAEGHQDALLAAADQVAVATQLALVDEDLAEAPASLKATLKAQAAEYHAYMADRASAVVAEPTTAPGPVLAGPRPAATSSGATSGNPVLPWLLTAAALLVAAVGWAPRFLGGPAELAPAAALEAMLAEAPADMLQLAWTRPMEDPLNPGATGEVVWSDTEQRGYMKFSGLGVNDPSVEQFQLWIFDDMTDTAHPVDGGVFDIPSGATEVVIPIDAKIKVKEAFQFAITVEKPGGVVVSDRERIPLLAAMS